MILFYENGKTNPKEEFLEDVTLDEWTSTANVVIFVKLVGAVLEKHVYLHT